MSFAVCSAGEILILAVMVGILKGLHAEDSTQNNTRAFSVLIAFTGGVWCELFESRERHIYDDKANVQCLSSTVRHPVVLIGETTSGTRATLRDNIPDHRLQTGIYRDAGMCQVEADVPVSDILFPDVNQCMLQYCCIN